jgi:mono/diheme cytochrome c family protein
VPPTPIPTLVPATLPPATPTEAAPSGGETPAAVEPPASPAELVEVGQGVYEQNCAVCHNLTDETLVGPGLAGLFDLDQLPNGQPVNDENLAEWITNGGGAMPAVPLPNDELEALIAFLHDATE